jgi:hypothetical protein
MKKIVFVALSIVLLFGLIACNPSQMALWRKQRDTGFNGGVVREITVYNGFTGKVIYQRTGKCFIEDSAIAGDFMILWTDNNEKTDFLGHGLIMVATEPKGTADAVRSKE